MANSWRYASSAILRLLIATSLFVLFSSLAFANTFNAFGPQVYQRQTSTPQTISANFSILNPNTQYTLHVESSGVASAVITLNGTQVLGPRDFNANVTALDRSVSLQLTNNIDVEVRSDPGSSLTIRIIGVDNDAPIIRATATPAANAAGWNNSNVTVTFTCSDATSGIATCPAPVIVSTEAANQVISGQAVDKAGNTASATVTLNIDKTPPAISATANPPANAAGWNNSDVTVTFTCSDGLAGIAVCPNPVLVSADGGNQVITRQATARARRSQLMWTRPRPALPPQYHRHPMQPVGTIRIQLLPSHAVMPHREFRAVRSLR